ncbi:nucleolar MIF4G domain-containing protein 1 [Trichinella spiralis]|uniref:nucleolar MIF4G domain-containing protein 1 n=1 Tax=Trichinella spiralis TaxID=6334 RepID=UPI0001EFC271|nr:nucleolar MIF4G domain-containing protein 1 [Trichinella spiralis]
MEGKGNQICRLQYFNSIKSPTKYCTWSVSQSILPFAWFAIKFYPAARLIHYFWIFHCSIIIPQTMEMMHTAVKNVVNVEAVLIALISSSHYASYYESGLMMLACLMIFINKDAR